MAAPGFQRVFDRSGDRFPREAVADRGYFSSPEILACHEASITVTLTSGAKSDRRFGKQDFVYYQRRMPIAIPLGSACLIAPAPACRFDRRDRPAATWRALPLSARSLLRASLLMQEGRAKKGSGAPPTGATTSVVL